MSFVMSFILGELGMLLNPPPKSGDFVMSDRIIIVPGKGDLINNS